MGNEEIFIWGYSVFFFFLFCGIPIAFFLVRLILSIWAYGDAQKRGKDGWLGVSIMIVLGIIGLILWLFLRPPLKTQEHNSHSIEQI